MGRGFRTAAIVVLLALTILDVSDAAAQQAPVVGVVARVRAEAVIEAGAAVRPAEPGAIVRLGETLRTGRDARLEVRLNDGTVMTLGEGASFAVDRYGFEPSAGRGSAGVRLLQGAFRLVTGRIGRLSQHDVEVRTPVATLGVRGTDVWGGPIDGAFSVFLLSGLVEIRTQAGTAVLDQPGEGVTLPAADQPPGPVVAWPQEKAARAVASVSF